MPIIIFISLMHLQHPNQTSNFCYFLADYWQVSFNFFYENFSSEKQKLNTKSLSKAENQKKKLYCEILNKSTAEIKVPQSNGGFLCFMTSILKSGNHKWIPYNIFALAFSTGLQIRHFEKKLKSKKTLKTLKGKNNNSRKQDILVGFFP